MYLPQMRRYAAALRKYRTNYNGPVGYGCLARPEAQRPLTTTITRGCCLVLLEANEVTGDSQRLGVGPRNIRFVIAEKM